MAKPPFRLGAPPADITAWDTLPVLRNLAEGRSAWDGYDAGTPANAKVESRSRYQRRGELIGAAVTRGHVSDARDVPGGYSLTAAGRRFLTEQGG